MNLDIMSLMAASAAVATTTQGVEGDGAVAADGSLKDGEQGSFSSILQSLTGPSSEALDDPEMLESAALLGATGLPVGPDTNSALESLGTNDTGLPVAVLPAADGEPLPPTGNELPLDLLATPPVDPSLSINDTARLQDPAALVGATASVVQHVAPTQTDKTVSGPAAAARTGWFSNAPALPTDPAAASNAQAQAQARAVTQPDLPIATSLANAGAVTGDMLATLRGQAAATPKHEPSSASALLGALAPGNEAAQALDQPRSVGGIATAPTGGSQTLTNQLATVGPATSLNLAAGGWDKALGQRLVFMAANGIDSAELRLDPPALGTVHVKLSLQGDQAQLLMQAANPAAREALETALPRLREMFDANGLQLDSAHVADREATRRDSHDQAGQAWLDGDEEGQVEFDGSTSPVESLTLPAGRIYEKV